MSSITFKRVASEQSNIYDALGECVAIEVKRRVDRIR